MSESVTPLDDIEGFYVRLARDLRELFQRQSDVGAGVSPADIWRLVAAVGDAPLGPEPFDFPAHLLRQRVWSERTFGPGTRAKGVVAHIRKELKEIEAAPGDLSEWVDVAILALDGAWRSGATPHQIIDALVAKQAKNEGRTWPDWRTMDPDGAIEHDRSGEPSAPLDGDWVAADDVQRLVRELDIALNGEAGAAEQASLCDIVAQVKSGGWRLVRASGDDRPQKLELTDALRDILGRPCFTLIHLAGALRAMEIPIKRKAEDEQAVCLHWMLNHYLKSGSGWAAAAQEEIRAARAKYEPQSKEVAGGT